MKNLTILTIFVLLTGCAGTPDKTVDGKIIPLDVQVILVSHNEKKPKEMFKIVKKKLLVDGFAIKHSDTDSFSVNTEYKNSAKNDYDMASDVSMRIVVIPKENGSIVRIRGTVRQGVRMPGAANLGDVAVKHRGLKGSIMRNGWDAMHDFAKKLPQTGIKFE